MNYFAFIVTGRLSPDKQRLRNRARGYLAKDEAKAKEWVSRQIRLQMKSAHLGWTLIGFVEGVLETEITDPNDSQLAHLLQAVLKEQSPPKSTHET